jgi:flagellin
MALSVLNNIPSLVAQDNLAITNNNLQNTLFQLSSGSRINSGADDPAGLSIVNGLQANIGALQQSAQNATVGVGQLQVADGALSQVTTLLNRAVTLATEAANGGLTSDQFAAITNEYTSITNEINRIGAATTFNGTSVFQAENVPNPNVSNSTVTSPLAANNVLTSGDTFTLNLGTNAYTWTPGTSGSIYAYQSANSGLTGASALTGGTFNIVNTATGGGGLTFTAGTDNYAYGTATTVDTALTLGDTLNITSNTGASVLNWTTVAGNKVGDLLNAINTAGAAYGISASLNGSDKLVIQGNGAVSGGFTVTGTEIGAASDFGALATSQTTTVNDLMNAMNTSGKGLTASLVGGQLQVVSSAQGGPITGVTDNLAGAGNPGTMQATNTVQDLVNWINGGGTGSEFSGISAGLAGVTNTNVLTSSLGGLSLATSAFGGAGSTLTITSGATGQNSYTATITNGEDLSTLVTAINNSGEGFSASVVGGYLHIVDTNGNGDIKATSTGNSVPGLLGSFSDASINQVQITDTQNRNDLSVTDYDSVLGAGGTPQAPTDAFAAPTTNGAYSAHVFISDGETDNPLYNTISVQIGPLTDTTIGTTTTGLSTANLGNATDAATALTTINQAISDVAAMRGTIGAGINRLTSATNVVNTQIQNLTSAQSAVQDANIGQVVANLSKYQVLEQTGIAALAQANSQEQTVLKLLQ